MNEFKLLHNGGFDPFRLQILYKIESKTGDRFMNGFMRGMERRTNIMNVRDMLLEELNRYVFFDDYTAFRS